MARTLDRKRPYGELFPTGNYEQDGIIFDGAGNEIVSAPSPEPAPAPERPPEPEPPPAAPPAAATPPPTAIPAGERITETHARAMDWADLQRFARRHNASGRKKDDIIASLKAMGVVVADDGEGERFED